MKRTKAELTKAEATIRRIQNTGLVKAKDRKIAILQQNLGEKVSKIMKTLPIMFIDGGPFLSLGEAVEDIGYSYFSSFHPSIRCSLLEYLLLFSVLYYR